MDLENKADAQSIVFFKKVQFKNLIFGGEVGCKPSQTHSFPNRCNIKVWKTSENILSMTPRTEFF